MNRSLAILAVAAFLAGCATPPAAETVVQPSIPATLAVTMDGCQAFHTFFQSPKQGFEPFVPEGFAMKDADPAGLTTTVAVFGYVCNNSTEMWAFLEIVPPATYANASFDVDAVILQGLTSNQTDFATYSAWGLGKGIILADSVSQTTNVGLGARDEELTVGGQGLSYTIHTTLTEQPAAFPATAYRYWIQNGTGVSGYILSQGAPATSLGAGTALYSQQGDPGAPPATAGIGHRVDGAALKASLVPMVAPAAPGNSL